MIKYLKLTNFSVFTDACIDFQVKGKILPMSFIYGENGSGKSSIVSALKFLSLSMDSLNFHEEFKELIDKYDSEDHDKNFSLLYDSFINSRNLQKMIAKYKTIGSTDPMKLEYCFNISDFDYEYSMEFNNDSVIREKLLGVLVKNKVTLFESVIDNGKPSLKLNKSVFTKTVFGELDKLNNQYFGKHTFLSIINYERMSKNSTFIKENISQKLTSFADFIDDLSISSKDGFNHSTILSSNSNILNNLENGSITPEKAYKIDFTESIVNNFFTSIYSDITKTFYTREIVNDKLNYSLFLTKLISGTERTIPFSLESTGTQKLLDLIPFFASVVNKKVVIIDEMDTDIHDLLMKVLVGKLHESTNIGQLIVTTHNTLILNSIPKEEVFIIDSGLAGSRKIVNLSSYRINNRKRIQKNHNIQTGYLRGDYGGIPIPGYFDFDYSFNSLCVQKGSDNGKN